MRFLPALAALSAALAAAGVASGTSGPLLLDEPTGIAVARDGSLLVVESGPRRLLRVAASGRVRQVATFTNPWGVAAVGTSAFVGDGASLVRVGARGLTTQVASAPAGDEVTAISATPGGSVFYATDHSLYRLAGRRPTRVHVPSLANPHGMAVRADGTLLVSDTNRSRILAVDPRTGRATTFARLGHPRGIAVDGHGTVYVSAADAHRIERYTSSGRRLGPVGPVFTDPYAVAVTDGGIVYALEVGPVGLIRRIDPDGASSLVAGRAP